MPYTRREFLGSSLAVVSTAATIPAFLHNAALADDAMGRNKPGKPDDRILVVVQLSGGNDGLNTVVPFGMDEYYKQRPTLAIPKDQVLTLDKGAGVGLHPQMIAMKEMMDAGLAGVVQGVGYPNPNRSHFSSMDIWHSADVEGGRGLGWLGKALDQHQIGTGEHASTACVCVGREAPLAAEGKLVKPVTFENANLFRWAGADLHPRLQEEYDKANRAGVLTGVSHEDSSQAAFLMRTALDAQVASDQIRAAVQVSPQTNFPGSSLANQLKMVAAMIRAQLPTRVYYVGMGGFDTHAGQAFPHGRNLQDFSLAMKAFYNELKALGQQGRVLTLAFSEFGRRVGQNASNGTDHGTAGPSFVFGPMVQPGLLGQHPSLSKLDDGDLIYNTDFRCLYASVLDQWLKIDSKKVLGSSFRPAEILDPKRTA